MQHPLQSVEATFLSEIWPAG